MMRALGPGSVSSFLKIILDVVYFMLWAGLALMALLMLLTLLLSFDPDLLQSVAARIRVSSSGGLAVLLMGVQLAYALTIAGVLIIVRALRRIFMTLTIGDPFHPDNINRLRLIGLMLAALEIGRYVVMGMSRFAPVLHLKGEGFNLTAWFSVLVVFVLAEVFREGARLRREAELTI
jgi:hypothetical protein